MEFLTMLLLISLTLWIYLYFSRQNKTKLPPGPTPLLIVGNLLQLGRNPHRSATNLSKIYGPLMLLKMGFKHTVIVSSSQMAKEILQKHDQFCPGREVSIVAQELGFHETMISFLPPGPKWRMFRKIYKEEMFATARLEATRSLRREKLRQLSDYLAERCSAAAPVSVEEVALSTTLNLLYATLFSTEFAQFGSDSAQETTRIVKEMAETFGTPNIADSFPLFKSIDPQRLTRRSRAIFAQLTEKLDGIVGERLESRRRNSLKKKDLLESLLDQENDLNLSLHNIKMLLSEVMVAGTGLISDTLQWVMAELLRNPEKMTKAKNELRTTIGEEEQVQESDISKLPYLRAVIRETLRLHPPAPFLVPRKAEADVEINGYTLPKGIQILINVWAIGRDPYNWSNPDSFEPQRFIDRKIDYKGQDFELLPFGSGRRMCPGFPLAHVVVHLMVATMIHNFDWELEPGMKPEDVDMNDKFGISLRKAVPLKAFPLQRLKETPVQ